MPLGSLLLGLWQWELATNLKLQTHIRHPPCRLQQLIRMHAAVQFDDGKELASIWDYDPPGDLAGSGAWTVLRELATTLGRHGTGLHTTGPL